MRRRIPLLMALLAVNASAIAQARVMMCSPATGEGSSLSTPLDGPANPATLDIAPPLPLETPSERKADARHSMAASTSALGDLGNGIAPATASAERWSDLTDTSRYLLIMGSADGFSAAGDNTPCFPGKDNSDLDADLKAAGFGDKDPAEVSAALAGLADDVSTCPTPGGRGYTTALLKSMAETDLATYLTGAVRAYAGIKGCEPLAQPEAARLATQDLADASGTEVPYEFLRPAFEKSCAMASDNSPPSA